MPRNKQMVQSAGGIPEGVINWLLEGDISIQYQVHRDIFNEQKPDLQARIATEGWGKQFLALRNTSKQWGMGFYQPKWISTHYTLLDIKNLGMAQNTKEVQETIAILLQNEKSMDGGINPAKTISESDVCVNGMFLNYACYFGADEGELKSIIDFLLTQQMGDGGFNCRLNRSGAIHSSLHTTLSVLEGINEYSTNGYTYQLPQLLRVAKAAREFILMHRQYKSDKTGAIINAKMLTLAYPSRWYYDILRALDYFRKGDYSFDDRMQDAIEVLLAKRNVGNTWNMQSPHPGKVHFLMEKTGKPSRWNTLRALRVLKHYNRWA